MYALPSGLSVGEWIRSLLRDSGTALNFYRSRPWRVKRGEVLAREHFECEDCRAKSPAVYSRATLVHHDRFVSKHPDLALSDEWIDERGISRKQLWALCHECHEARHGRGKSKRPELINVERW